MWASMKDYSLLLHSTLEKDCEQKLICKYCVQEFLEGNRDMVVTADDFGVCMNTETRAFACLLQVTCCSGRHTFMVELPRRTIKESDTENKEENKKGAMPQYLLHQGL